MLHLKSWFYKVVNKNMLFPPHTVVRSSFNAMHMRRLRTPAEFGNGSYGNLIIVAEPIRSIEKGFLEIAM